MNVDLTVPVGANKAEADLVRALGRLVRRKPEKKALIALKDAGKPIITHANVAFEAGRSRTSIGHDECRYKALRERITFAMEIEAKTLDGTADTVDRTRTSREIIRALNDDKTRLRNQRDACATRMNEALNVADRLEQRLRRAERDNERAQQEIRQLKVDLDRLAGHDAGRDIPGGRRR